MIYRDLSDVILISHTKNKGGITLASIVQRGGSYSVVYYTKENGIRKQKWESFRTEKDALHRKYMVEQYQQVKKELARRPQTVGQLIQEYVWLYGRAKWSLSMYTSTQGLIRNYINPYFGSVRLDELTPRLVSRLYMEFQQEPRYCGPYHKYERQSVSASTLKSVHKLLHSAFEQAVLWEYVDRNPFHKGALPKTKSAPSVFLSPEQIQLLLRHCSVSWLRLAIELSFVCTLRRGELLALTWDDINWEQNSLQISKTLCRVSKDAMLLLEERDVLHVFPTEAHSKTVLVLKSPKTESSNRIIYLPPSLKCSLLEWQNEQKKSAIGELPRLIFTYEDNRPLQGGVLTNHFQKLLAKCNLPKVTFHSLRHSSITYKLVLTGGDIKAVQGDSGHSQADMITEIYGHILDANRRKTTERFEEEFYQNYGTISCNRI